MRKKARQVNCRMITCVLIFVTCNFSLAQDPSKSSKSTITVTAEKSMMTEAELAVFSIERGLSHAPVALISRSAVDDWLRVCPSFQRIQQRSHFSEARGDMQISLNR